VTTERAAGSRGAVLPPDLPPDAKELFAQTGVDLSAGAPTGGLDPNTPMVYIGAGADEPVYRKKLIDGKYEPFRVGSKKTADKSKTLDEADDDFYRMSVEQLQEFQNRIVEAGIVSADSIRMGDYDEATQRVWQGINQRAASFYKVGQKRTPAEVLDMIESANRAAGFTPDQQVDPGSVTSVTPGATLEQQVQQAARDRLRRKLRPSEVREFVAVYQGIERGANGQALLARANAEAGTDTEVVGGPSMDVAAIGFVEGNFATEAASQDVSGYFEALRQMVGGP
jgi:hypothetical protein